MRLRVGAGRADGRDGVKRQERESSRRLEVNRFSMRARIDRRSQGNSLN